VAANRKLLLHCFNIYCDGSGFNKGIRASALFYSGNRLTKVLHFHLGSEDKHTVYEAGTIVQSSYGQSKMACLMQTRGRVPFMQGENGKDGQEMLLISNCIGSWHILTSDPTKRQTKRPSMQHKVNPVMLNFCLDFIKRHSRPAFWLSDSPQINGYQSVGSAAGNCLLTTIPRFRLMTRLFIVPVK